MLVALIHSPVEPIRYSIKVDMPVIASSRPLNLTSTDLGVAWPIETSLGWEWGNAAVAAVRTRTTGVLPKTLRGIDVAMQRVQVAPLSRLYSLAVETPVIVSFEPLYTALGAAGRAGTVTLRVADADSVAVGAIRIS